MKEHEYYDMGARAKHANSDVIKKLEKRIKDLEKRIAKLENKKKQQNEASLPYVYGVGPQ
jgi:chaperonin cofactor prefoldin